MSDILDSMGLGDDGADAAASVEGQAGATAAPEGVAQEGVTQEGADATGEAAQGGQEAAKPDEGKPPVGYVPHAALHAERQRVAELKAQMARYDARIAQMQAMMTGQAVAPAKQDEGAEDDPVALLKEVKSDLTAFQRQQQEQQEAAALQAYVERDMQQFAARQPDLPQAANFLIENRMQELRLMGYGDDEIQADIAAWDIELTRTAARAGNSVAEAIYRLATMRGYRAPVATQAAATAPAVQSTAKVEAIAKGQASERTLSAAAGTSQAGELDLKAILNLPDAEFAKIAMDESRWRKLAGGVA